MRRIPDKSGQWIENSSLTTWFTWEPRNIATEMNYSNSTTGNKKDTQDGSWTGPHSITAVLNY